LKQKEKNSSKRDYNLNYNLFYRADKVLNIFNVHNLSMTSDFSHNNLIIGFLFSINAYFFWIFIQIFRLIPFETDYLLIFAIIYLIAILADWIFGKYLLNKFVLIIAALVVSISLFGLIFSYWRYFFIIILLACGMFFTAFIAYLSGLNFMENERFAKWFTFSIITAFILNFFDRIFGFTLNLIIMILSIPIVLCLIYIILKINISAEKSNLKTEKREKLFPNSNIKNFLYPRFVMLLLASILSFYFIIFNNPSLIMLISEMDYIIIISLIIGISLLMILFIPNFKIKKIKIFLIITTALIFLPFLLSLLFTSFYILIIIFILDVILITFLILLFLNVLEHKIYISFIPVFGGVMIIYLVCAYLGLLLLFILINCAILAICIIIIAIFRLKDLKFSFNFRPIFKNKKIFSICLIIIVFISLIPLFYSYFGYKERINYGKKVLAFYYPWYGNTTDYTNESLGIVDYYKDNWLHWNYGDKTPTPDDYAGTDAPLLGLYDSNDPNLIKKHFQLAERAKIDGFICSWWGIDSYTDYSFKNIITIAEKEHPSIKFTIYFESNQQRFKDMPRAELIEQISDEIIYIFDKYSDSEYFLKVEGKPVMFFYTTFLYSPFVWQKIIQNVKAKYDCFLIADVFTMPEVKSEYIFIFDGIHIYNPTWYIYNQRDFFKNEKTFGNVKDQYKAMLEVAHNWNKLFAATVIPGYDDRIIREPGTYIGRDDGNTYDYLWRISKNADWVLITSFNEWHEGTEIEPSKEYGYYYIDQTAYWAGKFKD